MDWGEHWRIHYEQTANLHKKKEYREKLLKEGRNFGLIQLIGQNTQKNF